MAEELLLPEAAHGLGPEVPTGQGAGRQDHQRGARNHGSRLWAPMVLELWHRTFVDRTSGDGGAD